MNWLLGFLRELSSLSVNLADVVDVFVVTLLLYALLVLLRGTRAMQMLWGILIITGLYFLSRTLDLITLSTILGNLLAFLPIAIIVLFQREIRSMLAAFGSRTLLRWKSEPDEGTEPLNELALGIQALASKRIGAPTTSCSTFSSPARPSTTAPSCSGGTRSSRPPVSFR